MFVYADAGPAPPTVIVAFLFIASTSLDIICHSGLYFGSIVPLTPDSPVSSLYPVYSIVVVEPEFNLKCVLSE